MMDLEKIDKIINNSEKNTSELLKKYEMIIKNVVNNHPDYYKDKKYAKKYFKN